MNDWRHLWKLGFGLLGSSTLLFSASMAEAEIVSSKTSGTAALHSSDPVSPARAHAKTVAIVLQPDNAPTGAASTATGSEITVRLPLYSGAVSYQSGAEASVTATGSPYLRAGSAKFMVKDSPDAVEAWYVGAMSPAYTVKHGTVAGRVGVFPEITCTSRTNTGLTVEVDFVPPANNPNDTEIDYWVADYHPPARPQNTVLPSDVTKVIVDYKPVSNGANGDPADVQRTFTAPSIVRPLVHDINALTVDTRGALHGCSPLSGGASLEVVTKSGKTITVQLGFQCNRVQVGHFPALFDLQNRVWTDVSKDMGFKPYLQQ